MKFVFMLFVAILCALVSREALAQSGSGFYVSQELGVNLVPTLQIDADSPRGRGSICDEHVNPFLDLMPSFCYDPSAPGTDWSNVFDGAGGILARGAVGYRFTDAGSVRIEVEYFFRETAHNETSASEGRGGVTAAKLDGEVVVAEDRIGSVTSNNLFGNLYYDFISRSRVTPYVGVGAGVGFTSIDHGFLWVRNNDPDAIASVVPYFPADRLDDLRLVQQNLAGTTSSKQGELRDRLFGYQVLFGLDVALTEAVSVGVRGRRVAFGKFSDGGELDRLRSHISSNRLDGSDPITTVITTGDLVLYGISLSLKYQF